MTETKPSKFQKAEKKKSKLKLGITGPSGSGKTYSALRLAYGFSGKIAFIDTENGSASLYAGIFNFDVLELSPPFTTDKFITAIHDAEKENYDVIIVDSISHQWAGEGGLLREKEKLDQNPKSNSFANWARMTPIHDKFINSIIQCKAHIIVTMRSKEEYIQQRENDKTKIMRAGMSPIQRDGIIYELTTVFDIGLNHEAETSKDRTGLFTDKTFKVTEDTGKQLRDWLELGKELIQEQKDETKLDETPIVEKSNQTALKLLPPVEPYLAFVFPSGTHNGKHFYEIEDTILDEFMKKCAEFYNDKPMTEATNYIFQMYNEYVKNRSNKL